MARGPNEKNFSGDIPDGLADEVEDFITSHRDVKKKQVLAVALDFLMSLPEPVQATLMFTKRAEGSFQDITGRVTRAFGDDDALDIATAVKRVKNAIVAYSILSDKDKTIVDEFLGGLDIIRQAGGIPQKASQRDKSPRQPTSRRGSAKGA